MAPEAAAAAQKAGALPRPRPEWAYFVDLDGTLLHIAPSPSEVSFDDDVRALLHELRRFAGGAVALISGRSISDISDMLGEPGLPLAGQHGLERRDAAGRIVTHDGDEAALATVRERLAAEVERHPDLLLEQKGLSVALHYRAAPHLADHVHTLMRSLTDELGPAFVTQEGKRVVELKPAGKDKGIAVMEFMDEEPFRGRTPVFVGDDATDEYAFAVVNDLDGYSIKVGPGETVARWRLPDVRAVRAWLDTR